MAYLLLDPIIKHVVLTKLVLRDNSDFADLWSTPPVTPHIKASRESSCSRQNSLIGHGNPIWERKEKNPPNFETPFQVYFFNLTNAEKFFEGEEKPILKEVGPYVYQ